MLEFYISPYIKDIGKDTSKYAQCTYEGTGTSR